MNKPFFIIISSILIFFILAIMNSSQEQEEYQLQNNQVMNIQAGQWEKGSVTFLKTNHLKPEKVDFDGLPGWKMTIPGNRALATPAVADGVVYIGGGFGSYEFYAFNAFTGKPVWAEMVSDDGPTAAVLKDGYLAFNTESCTLFILNASTGKMVWSKWLGDPLMSQPALAQGIVFMAFPGRDTHYLTALDLQTGNEFWKVPIAGDIISAPVIYRDSVYLTTFDGTVYRYLIENGKEIWKKKMNATSAPWINGENIFVSKRETEKSPQEGIASLEQNRGDQINELLWGKRKAEYLDPAVQDKSTYNEVQKDDDASVGFSTGPAQAKLDAAYANVAQSTVRGCWEFQGSRPVYSDGKLYTTFGDAVTCIDPETEELLWEKKLDGDLKLLGGHLAAPPSVTEEKLYIGTATGWLLVLNKNDGSTALKVNIGECIRFQPSVHSGWVYVGTTAGNLYAVNTGDVSETGWAMWGGSAGHNGPEL